MQVSFRTIQTSVGRKPVGGALRARAAVRPALRQGCAFLLGLAGGWAVLYGALMPFGLGMTLGFGEDCFAVGAAGAALGLLARSFGALTVESICLLCGLGAAVAARWLWPGRFRPAALAGCGALGLGAVCFAFGPTGGGVDLLLTCGADALLAAALGFGKGQDIAAGLRASAGVLPEAETLENEGQFANFCFGQGELLATPVQIAGMLNALVTGMYREPLFLRNTLDETTGEPLTPLAHRRAERVVSEGTASALRMLLAGVVENGTGHEAALPEATAAGKTGTAQTGQFRDGVELKNNWFAGVFPAEKPQYTIVVLQDAQTVPAHSSAAIFAALAEMLENFSA